MGLICPERWVYGLFPRSTGIHNFLPHESFMHGLSVNALLAKTHVEHDFIVVTLNWIGPDWKSDWLTRPPESLCLAFTKFRLWEFSPRKWDQLTVPLHATNYRKAQFLFAYKTPFSTEFFWQLVEGLCVPIIRKVLSVVENRPFAQLRTKGACVSVVTRVVPHLVHAAFCSSLKKKPKTNGTLHTHSLMPYFGYF